MQNLLLFLYRFRTFGLFLLLEGICAWLIIAYNNRANASFLNSANFLAGGINSFSSNSRDYFDLRKVNNQLLEENRQLRIQLANSNLLHAHHDTMSIAYDFHKAKVINNNYRRSMNYITLDRGRQAGIEPGMAVINQTGVVGQVKSTSDHYSTVISLLHRNLLLSSEIKRTHTLCTVQWDGGDPNNASLKFVPRHIPVEIGDSVVTSGFNAVFPDGIMVGVISELNLADNDVFYEAKIDLAVDFSSIDYVYVIENKMKSEQDSIETITVTDQ
jgi:rod shape-determining protein MreC